MKFETTILLAGKTATGIEVPPEVVEGLDAGKRPPVKVTINDKTYRSTIAARGDRFLVGVSAENRELTGVAAGDRVEVGIEVDDEPRTVALPPDFAQALGAHPQARAFYDGLTASQKKAFVAPIEQAKKSETRTRRIEKAVGALREGRKG
ncbi:MAG: hypothetical protein QOI10_924 [Solirubrobacterales bacterium]|jgi:hypothetical protein|nr:hypothetical protein [Solirubrobacterales bacterium]